MSGDLVRDGGGAAPDRDGAAAATRALVASGDGAALVAALQRSATTLGAVARELRDADMERVSQTGAPRPPAPLTASAAAHHLSCAQSSR